MSLTAEDAFELSKHFPEIWGTTGLPIGLLSLRLNGMILKTRNGRS